MEMELISDISRVNEIREEWEGLLEQNRIKSIFIKSDYMISWWKYFARDNQLLILVMKNNGAITGIAPLMRVTLRQAGLSLNIIKFIGSEPFDGGDRNFLFKGILTRYGGIDFADFIVRSGYEEEFLSGVMSFFKNDFTEWDVIDLHGVNERSVLYTSLKRHACRLGLIYHARTPTEIYFRHADEGGVEGCNKAMSASSRKHLRDSYNSLRKKTGAVFSFHLDTQSIESQMVEIMELEQRAKGKKGMSMFYREDVRNFYDELLSALCRTNNVVLGTLRDKETLVAYALGFYYNNTWYAHNTAYNDTYAAFSPGTVLGWLSLCSAMEKGCNVDFGRGYSDIKRMLRLSSEPFHQVALFKRRPLAFWLSMLEFNVKPLVRKAIARDTTASRRGETNDHEGGSTEQEDTSKDI